jgi:hypothetical protein
MMKRFFSRRAFMRWLPLVAIVILLGVAGCTAPESTPTPTYYPQFTPAFYFVNINITEGGDAESGANVNFYVRAAQNIDTSSVAIIYYLDVTPPVTPDQPAFSTPGTYVTGVPLGASHIWKNVPPGTHTFSAQLVNPDDNTPFDPPVITQSTIEVPPAASKTPEIRIMEVQSSLPIFEKFQARTQAPLPPIEVQVSSAVSNIRLSDDSIGKANVPGEGHIIYYLDVTPPTSPGEVATTSPGTFKATTDDFHTWPEVPAGDHTLWLQVVNNDNTPLDPPVIAEITITVPALY